MVKIEIRGRTYEMDSATANTLADLMDEAVKTRSNSKARDAMLFVQMAECIGLARRIM